MKWCKLKKLKKDIEINATLRLPTNTIMIYKKIIRDVAGNNLRIVRRISVSIQGAARGAYCTIFNFYRNTEYGLKDKQDA